MVFISYIGISDIDIVLRISVFVKTGSAARRPAPRIEISHVCEAWQGASPPHPRPREPTPARPLRCACPLEPLRHIIQYKDERDWIMPPLYVCKSEHTK